MADNTLYDLRAALVEAYPELPRAREVAEAAGIVPGTLPSANLPMRDWWWQVIQELQRQGKLDALVDAAIADPTVAALRPRFEALRDLVSEVQLRASSVIRGGVDGNEVDASSASNRSSETSVLAPTRIAQSGMLVLNRPIQMEFVSVPAGPFLMGSDRTVDPEAGNTERSQHAVELPEYYIARFPVTNSQYSAFAKATGNSVTYSTGTENHPVARVSSYFADAFAAWLSVQTGISFRVPTEAEWEKAARGGEGRLWPWGNEWDPKRANTVEGGPGKVISVGQYSPEGDSPYGCADMAGNVWEWTSSLLRPYPYDPNDGREKLTGSSVPRVMRGGSCVDDRWGARCAFRAGYDVRIFYYTGFRLVFTPQREDLSVC